MDIVLSHTTALEVMRRPYFPRHLAMAATCPTDIPGSMPSPEELERARACCPQLAALDGPVDVLVSERTGRHLSRSVRPHLLTGSLPAGALVQLASGVRSASPLLLCAQMSGGLTHLELVMLLDELCGLYAIDPSAGKGLVQRAHPLVTPGEMGAFLDLLGPARGTRRVRRALADICEQAASPMEARLFLRATRGFSQGGYRLGEVVLNSPLELECISAEVHQLRIRKPDLLLLGAQSEPGVRMPFRGIALDYKGRWHDDEARADEDDLRRNELEAHGYKDYTIRKAQYDDLDFMDGLFSTMRDDLGLAVRRLSRERARAERAARAALWDELERIDTTFAR